MRSFWVICGYNFLDTVKRRFFKISTFLVTLFIIFISIFPDLILKFGLLEKNKEYLFYIVDNENYIFDNHLDLNLYANNMSGLLDGEYFFHLVNADMKIEDINEEMEQGVINGYLVVSNRNKIDIFTKGDVYSDLKFILDRYIVSSRVSNSDSDYKDIYINYGYNSSMNSENKFKIIIQNYMIPLVLSVFIYIIFVVYGQFLSVSVNIEKNSRITEIFLTKARLLNIILGKIAGVLLACTLQLLYFLVILFLISRFLGKDFQIIKSVVNLDLIFVIRYLVYFILGFILYGLLFMIIGNAVNKTEDLSIGFIPITFLISVGCTLTFVNIQFPQNSLIEVLNCIPFFTSFSIISKPFTSLLNIAVISLMIICIIILLFLNLNVVRSAIRFKGNNFRRKANKK